LPKKTELPKLGGGLQPFQSPGSYAHYYSRPISVGVANPRGEYESAGVYVIVNILYGKTIEQYIIRPILYTWQDEFTSSRPASADDQRLL